MAPPLFTLQFIVISLAMLYWSIHIYWMIQPKVIALVVLHILHTVSFTTSCQMSMMVLPLWHFDTCPKESVFCLETQIHTAYSFSCFGSITTCWYLMHPTLLCLLVSVAARCKTIPLSVVVLADASRPHGNKVLIHVPPKKHNSFVPLYSLWQMPGRGFVHSSQAWKNITSVHHFYGVVWVMPV